MGRIKKWQPKRWKPEYDKVVMFSVAGMSNTVIAEKLNITKEFVSQILNLPQALELTEKIRVKIREKMEDGITENLYIATKQAAKRVRQVLENDETFAKSPFAVTGLAIDVLKGMNHLKGGGNGALGNGETNIGALIINQGQKSDILDGLAKVKEVRQLHAGIENGNGER
jgi:hypothetical protein